MEWKWAKNLLIIIFILLDCFLVYKIFQKNSVMVINSEMISSIDNILEIRNIDYNFELDKVTYRINMKKISIRNEENIEPAFIPINSSEVDKAKYVGRNRKIISLPVLITTVIRDNKLENVTLDNISLGYYPEMSQIDKNVLSGEATPAWYVKLESGEEYIYNAYLGEAMNIQ